MNVRNYPVKTNNLFTNNIQRLYSRMSKSRHCNIHFSDQYEVQTQTLTDYNMNYSVETSAQSQSMTDATTRVNGPMTGDRFPLPLNTGRVDG